MTNTSFSQKRHDYIKAWPNGKKFDVELAYEEKLQNFGKEIFLPFPVKQSDNVDHNIAFSFVIDALDVMPKFPNFAFDFIFRAFDYYAGQIFGKEKVAEKLELSIQKWADTIDSNNELKAVFDKLLDNMPQIACQYLYSRLYKDYDGSKSILDQSQGQLVLLLKRLLKIEIKKKKKKNRPPKVTVIVHNQKFKEIIEMVFGKYGYDSTNYKESVRKGSRFYYQFFKRDSVQLDDANGTTLTFSLDTTDKLHMLVNGILYTMRNDRAHGSSSSSFKSSKASSRTYSHNQYCFLAIYFLFHLLIIDVDNEKNQFANVMDKNLDVYEEFYRQVNKE